MSNKPTLFSVNAGIALEDALAHLGGVAGMRSADGERVVRCAGSKLAGRDVALH